MFFQMLMFAKYFFGHFLQFQGEIHTMDSAECSPEKILSIFTLRKPGNVHDFFAGSPMPDSFFKIQHA
jgi:hypothetical protein